MTATQNQRGHEIYYNTEKEEWLYSDDGSSATKERPCKRCGVKPTTFGHDACLEDLTGCKGITNACCGHGRDEDAYILLADGRRFVLDKTKLKEMGK